MARRVTRPTKLQTELAAATIAALEDHGKPCTTTELRELAAPRLGRSVPQATFAYVLRKFSLDSDSPLVNLGWTRGAGTNWALVWGLEGWELDREHSEMDYLLSARGRRRRSPRRRDPAPAPTPRSRREVLPPQPPTLTLGVGESVQIVGVRLHDNGSDHVFTLRTSGGDVDVTLA